MRAQHWQQRLRDVIAKARVREWEWGKHDCVTFALEAVSAVSGVDYAAKIYPKYRWTSADEATRIIKKAGGLGSLVTEFLGSSVPWSWCGAGDIVLAYDHDRELLAVHDGFQIVAASERGIVAMPVSAALTGWRV